MPPVELAELLPIFAKVESQMARQSDPVGVSLLDFDCAVTERQKDLCVRIGIEGRLKADLEFVCIEIFPLHAARGRVRAHVTGCADLRIELRLIALASDEPARRRRIRRLRRIASDGCRGGGSQRRQIRIGGGGRWGPRPCRERGAPRVQAHPQRAYPRAQRVEPPLRWLLGGGGG